MKTYWLARDLNGVMIGRHQFITILTGDSPQTFFLTHSGLRITSRKIGQSFGLVFGAQRAKTKQASYHRLLVEPFERADTEAAISFFTDQPSTLANNFGYRKPEGKRILPKVGVSEKELAYSIIKAIDLYIVNEQSQHIAYPWPWLGKNSNSWVNSVFDASLANLPLKSKERLNYGNFTGADAGHDVRIHSMYFKGLCQPCAVQNKIYR